MWDGQDGRDGMNLPFPASARGKCGAGHGDRAHVIQLDLDGTAQRALQVPSFDVALQVGQPHHRDVQRVVWVPLEPATLRAATAAVPTPTLGWRC